MSCMKFSRSVLLPLVCLIALTVLGSAQHFEQLKGTLVTVSAGRNEVFGLDSKHNVWRYKPTTQAFGKIAKTSLVHIAVGGGNLSQLDEVWGIDASGNVFRFDFATKKFAQVTGTLAQITVGPGSLDNCHPYEVWGIAANLSVYRYDYCKNQFNESPGAFLSTISSNGGDVWGLIGGEIWRYSFSGHIFVQVQGALNQISVGVNDVWGVDGAGDVYRFDPVTSNWTEMGTGASEVTAGGDGVWVVSTNGNVFRFDSPTEKLAQVTGVLSSISAGSGAGIFGVTSAGQVYTFVRP